MSALAPTREPEERDVGWNGGTRQHVFGAAQRFSRFRVAAERLQGAAKPERRFTRPAAVWGEVTPEAIGLLRRLQRVVLLPAASWTPGLTQRLRQ